MIEQVLLETWRRDLSRTLGIDFPPLSQNSGRSVAFSPAEFHSLPAPEKRKYLTGVSDYALLKPDLTSPVLEEACSRARELGCFGFCSLPYFVPQARKFLEGSPVHLISVVGFPWGVHPPQTKQKETEWLAAEGVAEIDFVTNTSAIKKGDYATVWEEVRLIRQTFPLGILKGIIECPLLTTEEKVKTAWLVEQAGCQFVKTGSGLFGKVQVADVELLRRILLPATNIKAAGGIRTLEDALPLLEAGAERLGTSTPDTILAEISNA